MSTDWWRDFIISVPRPIPPGMMVGMRDEVRGNRAYIVEFLEKVPEYQPNPFTAKEVAPAHSTLCVEFKRDGEVLISWSREDGFTVLNGRHQGS